MKNILIIILCLTFFSCEMVATLFHGEKPEEPPVTYTVTYDANGATGTPPSVQTVNEGSAIILPNIGGMTSAGNTFVGWSESATIGVGTTYFVGDSITVTKDMVFYAQWITNSTQKFTISFNANGAAGAPPASKTVYNGLNIIIPDQGKLAYAGKMFGGWNTEADGSGILLGANSLYTVSGSIILYAQWYDSTDSFTVTYDINGGNGAVPSAHTVSPNAVITLPTGNGLSKEGFIFGGWNTNAAGTGSNYNGGSSYTVTGTVTLFAKWNSFFTGMADISAYLASQQGGFDPDEPIYLPVQLNLGTMTQTGSGWRQLLNAIASSGRYVDLDLSACTMNGTEFNPDINVTTGKDMIVSITLPNTVISIGHAAFANYINLVMISLPTGLTVIGDTAFANCPNLILTSLPKGLTSIEGFTFYGCTNLALTSLPEGITTIGENAFFECTNLTLSSLPNEITTIRTKAFFNCSNITMTSLSAKLESIGEEAFFGCTSLALTSLPSGLIDIGYSAFEGCTNLTLTSLPNGITLLRQRAFRYCTNIALTSLPTGITSIEDETFQGCIRLALTSLPDVLITIGNSAFYDCKNISITNLPIGFLGIGGWAFYNCIGITSMTMPASVYISSNPFVGCISLSSFTLIGTGNLSIVESGMALVQNNVLIACPSASGNITLPTGLTSIGYDAFRGNTNITQIILSEGITSIDIFAFEQCSSLTKVTLPESITSIKSFAFDRCTDLAMVICYMSTPPKLEGYNFYNSHPSLQIKVPAGSVAAYKAADVWSQYADRISAIE